MGKTGTLLTAVFTAAALAACGGPKYADEVTGKTRSEELKDQRPAALMIKEGGTLPTDGAFYEFMTKDGLRRLAVIKDWEKIKETALEESNQTAQQIAAEWDAVLVTSSPAPVALPYVDEVGLNHADGKSIKTAISDKGIPVTYHDFHTPKAPGSILKNGGGQFTGAVNCESLTDSLGSFSYDSTKKVYKDSSGAGYTSIILQNTVYLGEDGSDYYNLSDMNRDGWLINSGIAMPLTWVKTNDIEGTRFFNLDGEEVTPPEGNTLVQLIGPDEWEKTEIR